MSAAAGMLAGVHAMIAMRRSEPHWLLSEADAKRYGAALANALRHLPVTVTQKYLDFSALAFCVMEMETPRVLASYQLAAARRPGAQGPPGPGQVFQFTPRPGSPQAGAPGPAKAPPGPAPDFAMEFPPPEGVGP